MIIRLIKYIRGYLKISIYGYSPERFMNLCSNRQIFLWDIKNKGDSYEMCMSIKGFRQLKPIAKKTRIKIQILERHGLPFFLHKYRKRKMFFFGIVLCSLLLYVLSLYIWDIELEGNYTWTTDVILSFLEEQDVYHGMPKSQVDCEAIEALIRTEYQDITWASAEIRGTRLVIRVQESTDTDVIEEEEVEDSTPTDIVADKDCIIMEMITRKGVPYVKVGDVVKEGDLLVCGRVEVVDDNEVIINYQYYTSDADIYGKTVYDYKDEFSMSYVDKSYTGNTKKNYYLQLLYSKFFYFKRKNSFEEYDAVTYEKQLKLGKNFYLPIAIGTEVVQEYQTQSKTYSKEEAASLAQENLDLYCEKLEEKGVQILASNVKIYVEDATCTAEGTLEVLETVGKRAATEIKTLEEEETNVDELDGNDN